MAATPAAMPPIWARVRLGVVVAEEDEDEVVAAAAAEDEVEAEIEAEIEAEVEVEVEVADVGAAVVLDEVDEDDVEVGVIANVVELW